MNWYAIKKQRDRYNIFTTQSDKLDCLYLVAHTANLFSQAEMHEIDQVGMTKQQENQILAWMKANEASIDQCKSVDVA